MDIKSNYLIYFSPTEGTRKVVRGIASGTGLEAVELDFTILRSAPAAPVFQSDDLVIIGLLVYVGRIPLVALPYLSTLRGDNTPCILVGTYGNRHYDDMMVELEDLVREQGFVPVGAAIFAAEHSFSDELAPGRPNADDVRCAEEFGKRVQEKLMVAPAAAPLAPGSIPGGRPYRIPYNSDRPTPAFGPVVSEACINCGSCAERCPTGAIDPNDVRTIDATRCIKCRACVKVCPVEAIDIEVSGFWEHVDHLIHEYGSKQPDPVFVV